MCLSVLSFVARPWRVVDGSLNRPVCKGMLEALLLHIMTHPGVPEPALLQHYSGVLQPMVIMDLLKVMCMFKTHICLNPASHHSLVFFSSKVLEEMGCVIKCFTVNRPKASLFSRPAIPKVRGHGEVSVVDGVVAFYEPTVDCSLRLSKLFPHESCWNKWAQLCVH